MSTGFQLLCKICLRVCLAFLPPCPLGVTWWLAPAQGQVGIGPHCCGRKLSQGGHGLCPESHLWPVEQSRQRWGLDSDSRRLSLPCAGQGPWLLSLVRNPLPLPRGQLANPSQRWVPQQRENPRIPQTGSCQSLPGLGLCLRSLETLRYLFPHKGLIWFQWPPRRFRISQDSVVVSLPAAVAAFNWGVNLEGSRKPAGQGHALHVAPFLHVAAGSDFPEHNLKGVELLSRWCKCFKCLHNPGNVLTYELHTFFFF